MLIETKSCENLNAFILELIVINHQKGEIERASRPLVISVINDNIDYYD